MNIAKYLNRINFAKDLQPNLAILKELQKSHLLNIPFENLDIHTGVLIKLDIDKIYEKLIVNHRGGFCYELNGLFFHFLKQIGFDAKMIAAKVFHNEAYGLAFDHLAILVKIATKEYLVDVGFGEFIFHPLAFSLGIEQEDERGIFRIDKIEGDFFRVNKKLDGAWKPAYIFKNIERNYQDFEEMCQYHQSSPNSHFTQKKFVSIPTNTGRLTLTADSFKIKEKDSIEEKNISEKEFKELLIRYFNFKNS